MNYAGKFGSGELDSHSAASVDIDSLSHRGDADTVTIPDAHLLFSGDFQRSGADLIVSDHDHRVVVPNYFQGDKRATLVSPDGAPLDPKVVEALTGHVQYAQAAGTAAAVKVVGHVVKMTGSASVVRNGVTVTLNEGDTVLQNDVVQTGSGSTLGLVMIDGTTFNLSAGARLMLNDLTYDANSTSNTSLFTLVQGAASFVAGQVAKTGDMKVGTPAATMGIRGTAVVLDISAVDGTVSISVIDQRDGQIHAVQVFNSRGVLIGTVSSNGAGLTLTPIANFDVIARASDKTPAQIAQEFNVFQQALQLYQIQKAIDPTLPQHTENAPGDANPQQTKYAGPAGSTPPSPVDTPATTLPPAPVRTATAEATPATTTVVLTQQPAAGPAGTPPPSTPDPITFHIPVQTAQLPFVINTSTVPQISSGAGDHFGPVMSASGDVVYDPDGIIYFYDRETGATIRVTPAGDGFSYSGQTVSSDGRYIAYQGTNGTDTFVYIYGTDPSDTLHYHQQVKLVAGTSPAVSGDGNTILVEHGGSIGIHNLHGDLLGTITAAAAGVSGTVWKPAISADGHVVAFWSSDGAGGAGHLFTYDLSTGNITEIASTAAGAGSSAASFSADGRYVVYQSDAPGGHSEIYLYDLSAGQVIFHTENATGASYNPVISSDGDFIVFASRAALTPGDTNAFADTYTVDVRDPANPLYKLVSAGPDGKAGDADSDRGAAIGAGGIVVFGSNASNFSNDPDGGEGDIFISDPTSGRSAIIYQTATSPSTLHAEGVIALTGASSDRTGITLTVVDPLGNPTSLVTANFNANGDIVWNFDEARTADSIASLAYGQDFSQHFLIRQSAGGITTDTPVTITVHNGVQPTVTVVDVAPGALPVTLAQGTEDTSFTITAAALLAGVGDIDTPLSQLHITNVTIKSGGGSLTANENGTWTYTPAANFNGAVAFNYTVSDGTKTASSTASLHVAAVNDVATIDGNASGNVVEDSSTTASGALTVHDVDSGQNHFQTVLGAALVGTYGNFTFNANTGTWTYALDHTRADSLTAGQLVHDKLTVTSADGTASQVIDVAVVGSAETPGSDVTRLTFDDLPAVSSSGSVVPDGYGGLDWSNFNYLNSTTSYPVSGYTHGTVSGPNVAYNSFAQTATVSGATFNFIGADLTGAWNNGLSITVTGFNHGVLVDQETVVVDTNNPTWFEFDFNGITDLVFTSSGGVDAGYGGFGMHFAMDNFEYSASANNAATIAGDAAGSLVEDDTSTDASGNVIAHDIESGTLTVHDVDSGESHFRAVVPATLAGHYGNFTFNENTGAWTYTLLHAQADSLTAGQLVHDTLTVKSVDGTASQVIDVAITGSNDAPMNSVPGAQTVAEDAARVFSSANSNSISISDIDVGAGNETVTVAVTNGALTLAGTKGLSFSVGNGTADTTMTFSGTVAAINTALNGLNYTPTANFNGGATLTITTNDNGSPGGSSLSDIDTVALIVTPVEDAPVITGTTATGSVPSSALTPTAASYLTAGSSLVNGLGDTAGFGDIASFGGSSRTDDGSTGAIDLTSVFGASGLNFFGHTYTSLYINNNGNVTFVAPSSTFTPTTITSGSSPIIAPFWADVDTRNPSGLTTPGGHSTGSDLVYYSLDSVNHVVTVTWDDVGYFSQHDNLANAFQLQLIGLGNGDFDIVFRYEAVNWTTGDASSGSGGLGGTPARAGYSAGDGNPSHYFEIPGSGSQQMLALDTSTGNTAVIGVDIFQVQSGSVTSAPIANGTVQFADSDNTDTHTASFTAGGADYHGTFTLDPVSETGGSGLVAWHFALTNVEINNIAIGVPLVQNYTIAVNDGHAGVTTLAVSVAVGSASADTLSAGHAADVLIGAGGNDNFAFSSTSVGNETIVDFTHGADHLQISVAGAGFAGHGLVANHEATVINAASIDVATGGTTNGDFIFDTTSHSLYWDANGGSGADAVLLAHLQNVNSLSTTDFHLV